MASYCQQVLRARATPFAAAAVVAAAASTVCEDHEHSSRSWLTLLVPAVMGDAPSLPPAEKQAEDMARLKAWLTEHGADVSHIDFRTSKIGHDSGIGIYLADGQKPMQSKRRRWWAPFSPAPPYAIAAEFPLSLAITADNILNDSNVGRQYSWMVQRGVVDERLVLQCYLAVERSRGQASPLHPWITVLPNEFHSPLCWTDVELVELRGTPLLRATLTLRTRLTDQWQRLRVPLAEVAQHLGTPHSPAYEDLVWAHCVFWSRGQSLPVPRTPGAASRLAAQSSARQSLAVHEGIVPGLDFANHNCHGAGCWWEVVQPGMDTAAAGPDKPAGAVRPLSTARVRLQLHRGWQARAGDELTINYGDGKSNEELLLLYGFVSGEGAAQADTVMVACPVPPQSEWDDLTAARMELLTSYGMRPQFFLRGTGPSDNSKPTTSTTSEGRSASVPLEVLESLEVFVLKPEEVVERLEALHAHQARRQQGMSDAVLPTHLSGAELDLDQVVKLLKQKPTPAQLKQLAVQLGLRMAAVTTYVRLLEVRLIEMEGKEQGTGSLEEDEELLKAHATASTASGDAGAGGVEAQAGTVSTAPAGGRGGSGGGRGQGGPEGRRGGRGGSGGRGGQGPPGYVEGVQSSAGPKSAAGVLPYRRWCAVVYRAGQKRVVRAHLVGARQELQRVIDLLAQVDDLQVLKK